MENILGKKKLAEIGSHSIPGNNLCELSSKILRANEIEHITGLNATKPEICYPSTKKRRFQSEEDSNGGGREKDGEAEHLRGSTEEKGSTRQGRLKAEW